MYVWVCIPKLYKSSEDPHATAKREDLFARQTNQEDKMHDINEKGRYFLSSLIPP